MGVTYCPFDGESQLHDWIAANCLRCVRYPIRIDRAGHFDESGDCEILPVVIEAMSEDGAVPEGTARRMGYMDSLRDDSRTWPCPEFVHGLPWVAVFGSMPRVESAPKGTDP